MDILERMNGAIDYIEENISEEINYDRVAQIACCSVNHFQRMFSYITGISIAEYVRRRRLTLAALELQNSDIRIIDVAVKYNYDSPDSFTRAFQKMHGITPSYARENGVQLKSYPRMIFYIQLKGDTAMNYRIVEREGIELIGKGIMVTMDNVGVKAPAFWQELNNDGSIDKMLKLTKSEQTYGVTCYTNDLENKIWSYHVACKNNTGVREEGFEILNIPALTWVVFEAGGPPQQAFKQLWEKAYAEWFPSSGYTDLGGPEMEVYYGDKVELWIAIKKI